MYRDPIESARKRIEVLEAKLAERDEALRRLEAKLAWHASADRRGLLSKWRGASASAPAAAARAVGAGVILVPMIGLALAGAVAGAVRRNPVPRSAPAVYAAPDRCATLRALRRLARSHATSGGADSHADIAEYYSAELDRRGCNDSPGATPAADLPHAD